MKARSIDLSDTFDRDAVMRRVAIVRFAELLAVAPALRRGRSAEIHALRIACKRLRYALERFSTFEPSLHDAGVRLMQMQDALGDVHDRDVLLDIVPHAARNTANRLHAEREDAVARARALWYDAFAAYGPFEGLMRFTGLAYGVGVAAGTTVV